ncbi:putative amidoligase [Nemania sp. FL0916]|nr:putative amidoligase [Nemania sp. FL0916]
MSELYFGIEIEIYVSPKGNLKEKILKNNWHNGINSRVKDDKKWNQNLQWLRRGLVEVLIAADVKAGLIVSKDHIQWAIVEETIDPFERYWGVELVSMVLNKPEDLNRELDVIFSTLYKWTNVATLPASCGTHIHVSLSGPGTFLNRPKGFKLDQLKALLKAVALYERPIIQILPTSRKQIQYAVPNFSSTTPHKEMQPLYDQVQKKGWHPLFEYIRKQKNQDNIINLAGNSKSDHTKRYTAWNFSNIGNDRRTLEFRSPPGVVTSEDAKFWAAFTVAFVSGAIYAEEKTWQPEESVKTYYNIPSLQTFIRIGASHLADSQLWNKALLLERKDIWKKQK